VKKKRMFLFDFFGRSEKNRRGVRIVCQTTSKSLTFLQKRVFFTYLKSKPNKALHATLACASGGCCFS